MMGRGDVKGIPAMVLIVAALAIGVVPGLLHARSTALASRPAYQPTNIGPRVSVQHGAEIYQAKCSLCHGADYKGVAPGFPSLLGVTNRLSDAQIFMQIRNGKGRMLAFPDLSDDDLHSLLLYLKVLPNPAQPASSEKPGA